MPYGRSIWHGSLTVSDEKSDPVDDKRVVCDGFSIFALEEKTQVAWRLSNRYQDISEGKT